MLKKILLTLVVFVATLSTVFASTFYVGASAKWQKISATHVSYSGAFPTLAIGIGDWTNNWFYLAAEAFADLHPIQFNNETFNNENLRIRWEYGASIIPGIYFDEMLMGYLRLGMISTDFDELDTWKSAYQVGAGIQSRLNACWDVRAEYIYSRYRGINDLGHAKMDTVGVGVIYRFG